MNRTEAPLDVGPFSDNETRLSRAIGQFSRRKVVRAVGIEPTHPCGYQILSLARLPVPPRPRRVHLYRH